MTFMIEYFVCMKFLMPYLVYWIIVLFIALRILDILFKRIDKKTNG
jgi:uncharacterized membrane-anchored protein YitT (DUF2179 family)